MTMESKIGTSTYIGCSSNV